MPPVPTIVAAALLWLLSAAVGAQGVSTAGIRGSVSVEPGQNTDARVRVSHDGTGFSVEVRAAGGRFLVEGLEPGGPYTVTVRALGYAPQRAQAVFLSLGELREMHFALQPIAARLDTLTVVATLRSARGVHDDGGTGMTIAESMLDHLPSLNRDLYDFVRLVPQVSTKIGLSNPGLSAGGVGFRFNNFLINGVSERTLSGGVSNAFAGNKSIPLSAVQAYEVLLAPYDVRYGDFAGALVNTITKSGTNIVQGSVFVSGRNDQLAGRVGPDSVAPYDRVQYGMSLGGPILRNRLHFFVAPEFQRFTFPADGPYVGQPANAQRPAPVSPVDLDRFDAIMRGYQLTTGSAGPVENGKPLRNLFSRLDLSLPAWNSRAVVWNNYSGSDDIAFSRSSRDTFSLSSYQVTRFSQTRTSAVHLHTALGRTGGGHNELLVSYRSDGLDAVGPVRQPLVRVSVGSVTLNAGTNEVAQGGSFRAAATTVSDNVTLPLGMSHIAMIGAQVERFRVRRRGAVGSYGTWSFSSVDDFARGVSDEYEVRIDFGTASAPISGNQYAAFAEDRWQVTPRLSMTGGVRGDMLATDERPPYHPLVDSIFGRRTDERPRHRVELSPRVGFTWDVSATGEQQLRGGLGIFASRYPLAWVQSALSSYGIGGTLRCNFLGPAEKYPPAFTPLGAPPTSCRGGSTVTPANHGDVDLVDPNLRMVRVARGSLAYERRLPWNLIVTNEALVTHGLSDVALVNLNLSPPETTDPYGRVMYGTIGSNGTATSKKRSDFAEVIDLRNAAGNRAYQLSTRVEKTRATGTSGSLSYTFSHARDAQTVLRVNTRGTTAWASARAFSGRQDDLTPGISSNDVPHRVIAFGTYVAPWIRARSELSFYYVGESGRPFTYIASGVNRLGDLNADGSNVDDPIYVPRNALDTAEIRFSGASDSLDADNSSAAQATRERVERKAFEDFVGKTSCLRRQRGRIMERNSCREPWSNTTIASIRQEIPVRSRAVELQLDVFNVLNLLNADWGRRREASPGLLEHVGQTGSAQTSRPIFRFSPAFDWTTVASESVYQLQLALRYRF